MGNRASAIAWFTRDSYERVLNVMDDADMLPSTFDEWLICAKRVVERLEEAGHTALRIIIEPRSFEQWCRFQGFACDAEARGEYVRRFSERGWQDLWVLNLPRDSVERLAPNRAGSISEDRFR
jgi:hypothetical protein